MKTDDSIGIIVLLGIIAIVAFGGIKNAQKNGSMNSSSSQSSSAQASSTTQNKTIQQQLSDSQKQLDTLQKQLAAQKLAEARSSYYGIVSIKYVNRSSTVGSEYAVLHMKDNATTTIQITGWRLQSVPSGQGVDIPGGTELFFSGTINSSEPIIMTPGDTLYLITGTSPNGYSFRLNKCSGYLSQFQKFTPYISTNCPTAKTEAGSSVPNIVGNYDCLDYINRFPSCKILTTTLPYNWSYECKNVFTKLNYNSCINNHKTDKDFYKKEWRVYLSRSTTIWQSRREDIILYDTNGKIVSELTY